MTVDDLVSDDMVFRQLSIHSIFSKFGYNRSTFYHIILCWHYKIPDSQQKLERELAASLPPPASKPKRDNVKPKRLQDDQPDDNPKAKALVRIFKHL